MIETQITVEDARDIAVDLSLLRLLAPEEVSEHAMLPLFVDEDEGFLFAAADPAASDRAEWLLRSRYGVRRVDVRPATREAIEFLLAEHFFPYWTERGWSFAGLPPEPSAAPPVPAPEVEEAPIELPGFLDEEPEPDAKEPDAREPEPEETEDPKPAETAPTSRDTVIVVENRPAHTRALAGLLAGSGYETRFAESRDDVERELRRSPPGILAVRRDGPVSPAELTHLVKETGAATELRVVPDYAASILGEGSGDARLPAFLFEMTRFLTGVLASAGGGRFDRIESRARQAEQTARRLNLPTAEIEAVRLAALLSDLDDHLTRVRPAHGGGGTKARELLMPMLNATASPFPIGEILADLDEKFDGSGPLGRKGQEIPAGARILAAVDGFLALKEDGVDPEEMEARIREQSGTTFDPLVVEALLRAGRAERIVTQLDQTGGRILLVDPDPVAASLLEMRLGNAGFAVELHREGSAALEAALGAPPSLVLSEVAVPGMDGFTLLLRLRKNEATKHVPFLFVSEKTDRSATVRGLELGADDFLKKPVDLELLAAKAKGLVKKARARMPAAEAPAGVSGDLKEMELLDLLQVLASSGRSVQVRLEHNGMPVGMLAMDQGRVVDARAAGETGIEAFNAVIGRKEGRFVVESAEPPAEPTIDEPLESLLLEACRLIDEAGR